VAAKRTGRKLKLNREMIEKAYELAKEGMTDSIIFPQLGMSHDTFYKYMRIAEEDESEGRKTLYTEFAEAIKKGRSEARDKLVRRIEFASRQNWTAAAWLLERTSPEEFALKQKVDADIKAQLTVKLEGDLAKWAE
jgi:hypothetical protein